LRKSFALLAGIILLFTTGPIESRKLNTHPAQAQSGDQPHDGNSLLRDCTSAIRLADGVAGISEDDVRRAMFCSGYLSGFLDAHALTTSFNGGKKLFCLPESGISGEQAARVIVKFLQDHPERLHESARILAMIALQMAFPCK
jgi:Rap1a immunity proteins